MVVTMTLEELDMTEEELMQVRDRSLEAAYETHDVGQEILESRLETHGFTVEQHGTDARHVDDVYLGEGPDLAIYRPHPRYTVNDAGLGSQYIDTQTGQFVSEETAMERVAYIEIKTKTDPEWFGFCNLRHLREYVNFHNETDVPVFIWFCFVKEDTSVVHREAFVEITDMDQIEGDVVDVRDEEIVFDEEDVDHVNDNGLRKLAGTDAINVDPSDTVVDFLPNIHGNDVVQLNDREYRSWPHFLHVIS